MGRRRGWAVRPRRNVRHPQIAFVQPTSWNGEKVARLCFVNPRTTMDHVRAVIHGRPRAAARLARRAALAAARHARGSAVARFAGRHRTRR